MYRYLLIFVVTIFGGTQLHAQSKVIAQVVLDDGSQFNVTSQTITFDEELDKKVYIFELAVGTKVTVPVDQVRSIEDTHFSKKILGNNRQRPQEGFYFSWGINTLLAKSAAYDRAFFYGNKYRFAAGMNISAGHRFNENLKAGGGVMLDLYDDLFYGPFAEVEYSRDVWKLYPVAKLQAGYSWYNTLSDDYGYVSEAKGGAMIYPSIGLQFFTRRGNVTTIDFGYKFQSAEKTYNPEWIWYDTMIESKQFRSFATRVTFSW